jgi:hypothetical protein
MTTQFDINTRDGLLSAVATADGPESSEPVNYLRRLLEQKLETTEDENQAADALIADGPRNSQIGVRVLRELDGTLVVQWGHPEDGFLQVSWYHLATAVNAPDSFPSEYESEMIDDEPDPENEAEHKRWRWQRFGR